MKLKSFISDEAVNTKRQIDFDYIKTLSILFMVIVHVYEELSVFDSVDAKMFDDTIELFGGPFAAPIFMIAMGLGIVYSKHRSPNELMLRGLKLFIFAYVLNFVRDGIPAIIYYSASGYFDTEEFIYLLFNIDILHLAGLTFMLSGFLKKHDFNLTKMLFLAVIMQAVGNFLLAVKVENTFLVYFLGLFMYTSEASCFPLLMWFIYPVIGMELGRFLKQVTDLDGFHKMILGVCTALYIGIRSYVIYTGSSLHVFYSLENDIYYKQNFLSTVYTVILFGIVKSVFYFLCKKPIFEKFADKCNYIGNNLNEIYINQWIIIGWTGLLLRFGVIGEVTYPFIIPVALVIYFVSIALAKYTRKFVTKYL